MQGYTDLPGEVANSKLWEKVSSNSLLQRTILDLRAIAAKVAEQTARTLPEFTDHSVSHMDSLWRITSHVLTEREIELLTPSEAFLLGSSF